MLKELAQTSPFFSANIVFISELYQKFLQNPNSIDQSWADFFKANADDIKSILADYQGPSWQKRNLKVVDSQDFDISNNSPRIPAKDSSKKDQKVSTSSAADKNLNFSLSNLIASYKRFGHLVANLDPLGLVKPKYVAQLDPKNNGIEESDLNAEVIFREQKIKVSQLIAMLDEVYSNKVGVEFEHICCQDQKNWLALELEKAVLSSISKEEKEKILKEIIRTEGFENFIHKRFPGAKRFSIEGGDSSINAIEKMIDVAAKDGVKKIIIGMAHRGRLNVLTGVMGKPYHQIISEFQGKPGMPENVTKSGDVKYHMGYSSSREVAGNKIDLSLAFNPSHLEAVNCVVTGQVRAKQDLLSDETRKQALAILIHGDAAFVGQGSVAENLVMNGTEAYDTGGVIHLIINNQIGFTANPKDSRSTNYASDLAKAIEAPIFHVNGDDVEAVVKVANIATKFRQTFKKDVIIDVICYRKYGHNEGDEPLYTQPVMYGKIKDHPSLEKIYSQKLIDEGSISLDDYENFVTSFNSLLVSEFNKAAAYKPKEADWLKGRWSEIKDGDNAIPKTAVDKKTLKKLITLTTQVPADFAVNPKILRQLEARKQSVDLGQEIDWGCGEALAFASLIAEGFPVRISGQDSGRGTFSHRHSILHDAKTGARHNIFSQLDSLAKYQVYDSVLSEYGVLGFEYGYSLSSPNSLVIWEAQFGDFANGAQIIFDQFIASSEVKWLRKSGLVMLLPHGYEGQGPEHSSARLERYLQACADNNMRVVNITNPANFFHVLRRQIHGKDRKPLIVMSPKSLLRHKLATSKIEEFSELNFRPLIAENSNIIISQNVRRVVLCSGKIYYDLFEAREASKINDVAIIRLEQLYPFARQELISELKKYKNAEVIWCQEEPRNMGAWKFVEELIDEVLIEIKCKNSRVRYVGRVACSSPATGYASYHAKEQKLIIEESLK